MDELSTRYKNTMPFEHRKKFGQFFTPSKVAELMTDWISTRNPSSILDPSYGLGVFSQTFEKICKHKYEFTGIDIDGKILEFAQNKSKNINIQKHNYLKWLAPHKYEAIICNPPYGRFQNHLERHEVIPKIEKMGEIKIKGHTNIASLFLLKSLCEIEDNGMISYIMPYEFFNTSYGENIKEALTRNGLLKHIVVFENEKDIFHDAVTTVVVLLIKKDNIFSDVKITKISTLNELTSAKSFSSKIDHEIPLSQLEPKKKWTVIIDSQYNNFKIDPRLIPLKTLGKFTRGIATGANNFFSLDKSKINQFKIPEENIVKCITKSPQVKKFSLDDKDFQHLSSKNNAVFCLNVLNKNDFFTKKYISAGEQQKIHLRYLTKSRNPWFKLEKRTPAPILAGVFNRGRLKFIRNFTDSINFTCFHSFYPNDLGTIYLNQLYLYLISDFGQKNLRLSKRSYGAGLDKFEPNDLKWLANSQR